MAQSTGSSACSSVYEERKGPSFPVDAEDCGRNSHGQEDIHSQSELRAVFSTERAETGYFLEPSFLLMVVVLGTEPADVHS